MMDVTTCKFRDNDNDDNGDSKCRLRGRLLARFFNSRACRARYEMTEKMGFLHTLQTKGLNTTQDQ